MIKKKKAMYMVATIVLLAGLYFYFLGNPNSEKVTPSKTIESIPSVENAMPSKEKEESPTKTQKTIQATPAQYEKETMKRSPALTPAPSRESVNLEEHSYSIKNENKEIPLTPGISLQRGKSVNVKIPGEDEIIRIQRDKTYHPGGYNVLLEKKF